ncbi:hypothetical protein VFPPC_15352 [Pochonia chlamydosporia 170]|uniref:Uncharacterized protein n=1 Tax=Pochonia chlamydosporia 170 TaxID=1380566 RepID=A0A179G897_METCM|nr:hypothetical protein VFPPC_15352 [Pochonia chlamydosporia 170]OAQ73748.1 hypothetical protein VFPPC_15352 [Pochonia chlamydosporia 170]
MRILHRMALITPNRHLNFLPLHLHASYSHCTSHFPTTNVLRASGTLKHHPVGTWRQPRLSLSLSLSRNQLHVHQMATSQLTMQQRPCRPPTLTH